MNVLSNNVTDCFLRHAIMRFQGHLHICVASLYLLLHISVTKVIFDTVIHICFIYIFYLYKLPVCVSVTSLIIQVQI